MSLLLTHVPEGVASIARSSKYLHMRMEESDAISNILLPAVAESYYPCNDDEDNDDDDSFVDTFHPSREGATADDDIDAPLGNTRAVPSTVPKMIVIRGMAGIGKSTLAAIVACRQDIRQAFDCICWVNVGKRIYDTALSAATDGSGGPAAATGEEGRRNNLSYDMYRDCLRAICKDLDVDSDRRSGAALGRFTEEVVCNSGASPMQVAAAQLRAMLAARHEMARMLAGVAGNMLVVLDDVWCYEDVDLFNFCSRGPDGDFSGPKHLAVLVTSRTIDEARIPLTYTLSLGILSVQEGVKLLGWELGLEKYFDFDALDISDRLLFLELSKRCGYLPLAIRILGRSLRSINMSSRYSLDHILKQAMMGWNQNDLEKKPDSLENDSLYFTVDRTFSLVLSKVESSSFLKLCFGALVVAFARAECQKPWTSLSIVLLLWESLLKSQDEQVSRILRGEGVIGSEDVFKILETIGVIDVLVADDCGMSRTYVRIHHDLLWEFGKQYLEINFLIKLNILKERRYFSSWLKSTGPADNTSDTSAVVSQFMNKQVVDVYEELTNGSYSSCLDDGHIFTFYPLHIIASNDLSKAFDLLGKNQNFIDARLQVMGIELGVERHMQDVTLFYKKMFCNEKMSRSNKNDKCDKMASEARIHSRMMGLVNSIVFAIVSFDHLSVYSESNTPLMAIQKYNCLKARGLVVVGAVIQKFNLWNISMDCFLKALQYLKYADFPSTHPDMLRIMRYINTATLLPLQLVPRDSPQRIVLKYADLLRRGSISGVPLVLSSHPGHAIVPAKDAFDEIACYGPFCILGIGAEESAIKATVDGDFITRIEDGAIFNVMGGWLNEGVEITLKFGPKNEKERQKQLTMTNGSRRFIINIDGTVSPRNRPILVLGTNHYPRLYLVDRCSPNCAVFKNIDGLSRSGEPDVEGDDGIPLELLSHPSCGIGALSPFVPNLYNIGFMNIGMCKEENALKVVYRKNNLIISCFHSVHLTMQYPVPYAGNSIMALGMEKPPNFLHFLFNKFRLLFFSCTYFSLNSDGTISPMNAPHLALGFQVPNFSIPRRDPILGHTNNPLQNDSPKPLTDKLKLFLHLIMTRFLLTGKW